MKTRPSSTRKTWNVFSGIHAAAVCLAFLILACFANAQVISSNKNGFNILIIFSEQTPSEIRTDLSGAFFDALAARGIIFESELVELDSLHDPNQTSWDEKLSPRLESIKAGKYDLVVAFVIGSSVETQLPNASRE